MEWLCSCWLGKVRVLAETHTSCAYEFVKNFRSSLLLRSSLNSCNFCHQALVTTGRFLPLFLRIYYHVCSVCKHSLFFMPSSKCRSGIYRLSKRIIVLVFEYCLEVLLRLQGLISLRRKVARTYPSLGIHVTRLVVRLVIYHNLVRLLPHVGIWEVRTIIEPEGLAATTFLFVTFWDLKIVLSRDPILLRHSLCRSSVLTEIGIIIPALFRRCLLFSV